VNRHLKQGCVLVSVPPSPTSGSSVASSPRSSVSSDVGCASSHRVQHGPAEALAKQALIKQIEKLRASIATLDQMALARESNAVPNEHGDDIAGLADETYLLQLAAKEAELRNLKRELQAVRLKGGSFDELNNGSKTAGVVEVQPDMGLRIQVCVESKRCADVPSPTPVQLRNHMWQCLCCLVPATTKRFIDEVAMAVLREVQGSICPHIPKEVQYGAHIVFHDGTALLVCVKDAQELVECLGEQMQAYRKQRLNQMKVLRFAHSLKATPYDHRNIEHEQMLMQLWQATFPRRTMDSAVSERWKELGFQGNNPATDFRGMGLLGLRCLIYFAQTHADEFRGLLAQHRDYPVACAGINITAMLLKRLVSADGTPIEASPLFALLCRDGRDNGFEEVYCSVFVWFDTLWARSDASYMDFPAILEELTSGLSSLLDTGPRPRTIADLNLAGSSWLSIPSLSMLGDDTENECHQQTFVAPPFQAYGKLHQDDTSPNGWL